MSDDSDHEDLPPTELPETQPASANTASTDRIGPYRLLDKLGEGGMGEVWLADQTEPVKRKVALKVIKQGMDTKQVVARFEAERQALAMMDHPAIAKVYDAGATSAGRPYFAMEHVKGVPISEYCDRHKLTNRERLELFMQVCEGVQHAHQKAVIHRDLKPGNVLVAVQDDRPVPKIIDFGVAKAMAQKLTEQTMHTQLGVMIGTPVYMSPEQAEMTGEDVDTRTDVYALGVMLYELIVGALPFDVKEYAAAGLEGIARKIREDEPPKPSRRLTTLGDHSTESAKKRQTELPALKRELSGDLDWITMKAMEKDRTRRYSSAHDLAADIERYLTDEPVLATPPSASYRARKFVRRHTWGVAAAAAGVLVLLAFAATMAVQAKRIAAERDAAEQARANLESVVNFQVGMLSETDPEAMGRRLMEDLATRVAEGRRSAGASEADVESARATHADLVGTVNATDLALGVLDGDILARAVATIDEEFADQPAIDARLRGTIGETYRSLGLYEPAERQLEAALETRRELLGREHEDTLRNMHSLALLYLNQSRHAEAEPLFLEIFETRKRLFGDEHPSTLLVMSNLAGLYWNQGRYAEVEPLYLATLETRRRVLGDEHEDTLISMNNLVTLYMNLARYTEAESLCLEAVATSKRVFGDEHRVTMTSMNTLATLYWHLGRYAEAEPAYLATLESRKRTLGTEHQDTLSAMNRLAALYAEMKRYAEAEQLFLTTLEIKKRVLGDDHRLTLRCMDNLATLYLRQGRYAEAEPLYLEALEKQMRVLGEAFPAVSRTMSNLAALYWSQGRDAEAESWAVKTIETRRRVLGDEHPRTLEAMNTVAYRYVSQGRYAEAEPLYVEAFQLYSKTLGDEHRDTLTAMNNLGGLYVKQGRLDEAEDLLTRSLEARLRVLGSDHLYVGYSHYNLGCLAAARGRRDDALEHLRRAVDLGWAEGGILTDRVLDPLRGDPEFEAVASRVKVKRAGS